jgi:Raf kinase inhibitor-like YbhB/YbcL family protein
MAARVLPQASDRRLAPACSAMVSSWNRTSLRATMRTLVLAAALFPPAAALAAGFTARSPDIRDGGPIPMVHVFNQDGCKGANQSPALSWSGEPEGTRSFAITMFDPDAPTGRGWWHWTVFNIPATAHFVPENAGVARSTRLPLGAVQGRTDYGFSHYGGPCPPAGAPPHRYVITVYAVRVPRLPLTAQSSGAGVASELRSTTLGTAQLVGRYGRSR